MKTTLFGASSIKSFTTMNSSRPDCIVMPISTHQDASPTTLRVLSLSLIFRPQSPKPFQFNMCADHLDFLATVEEGWNVNVEGTPQFSFCRKLKALKAVLKEFNNQHYSHISVRAKERISLCKMHSANLNLTLGMNSTLIVTKEDGSIITEAEDIAQEFVAYYASLLDIEVHTLPIDDGVFEWRPKLSFEYTLDLCRPVTLLEVKEAIF
ncbi:UNVERIFIED_CONTAM: hypothetical protein Sindi_0045700 [Sesamum indicum]